MGYIKLQAGADDLREDHESLGAASLQELVWLSFQAKDESYMPKTCGFPSPFGDTRSVNGDGNLVNSQVCNYVRLPQPSPISQKR
jgi:hypothetical protein